MINSASALFAPSTATDLLTRVMRTMRIVPETSNILDPGDVFQAKLVPASPQLDLSGLALAALDGLLDVAAPTGTEGSGLPDLPGSPSPTPSATAQSLTGRLGLPNLSVRVDVQWYLRDEDGTDVLKKDSHVATGGAQSPAVSLLLPPVLRELSLDEIEKPDPDWFCLSARVTLTLECSSEGDDLANIVDGKLDGDSDSVCRASSVADAHPDCPAHGGLPLAPDGVRRVHLSAELPGVPVAQLPVLIPSVVICCNTRNFDLLDRSAVLMVVPKGSPLSNAEAVIDALRRVEKTLRTLRTVGAVAGWILGIQNVLSALSDHPIIRFYEAKEADNVEGLDKLSRIKLWPRPWYKVFFDDESMHDRTTSIAVLGGPGRQVRFYDKPNYKTGDGAYTLSTSATSGPVALINDLNTTDSEAPVAQLGEVLTDDTGHDKLVLSNEGSWDDSLDSIEFRPFVPRRRRRGLTVPSDICRPLPRPGPSPDTRGAKA